MWGPSQPRKSTQMRLSKKQPLLRATPCTTYKLQSNLSERSLAGRERISNLKSQSCGTTHLRYLGTKQSRASGVCGRSLSARPKLARQFVLLKRSRAEPLPSRGSEQRAPSDDEATPKRGRATVATAQRRAGTPHKHARQCVHGTATHDTRCAASVRRNPTTESCPCTNHAAGTDAVQTGPAVRGPCEGV